MSSSASAAPTPPERQIMFAASVLQLERLPPLGARPGGLRPHQSSAMPLKCSSFMGKRIRTAPEFAARGHFEPARAETSSGGDPAEPHHTRVGTFVGTVSRRQAAGALSTTLLAGAAAMASRENSVAPAASELAGMIYDTTASSFLPPRPAFLRRFRERVTRGSIIAVGETHSHLTHHKVQLELLRSAHQFSRNVALGGEMFLSEHQPFLDAYVSGAMSMRTLVRKLQWNSTWGYDIKLYAPLLRFCRLHQIPIAGLNISPAIASKVGKLGLEGLSDAERRQLPELDLDNAEHLADFLKIMASSGFVGAHGGISMEKLRSYYHVKVLWDEHMAEKASRFAIERGIVARGPDGAYAPAGTFLLLCGSAHVENRRGVPDRIKRRIGIDPFVVVPRQVEFDRYAQPVIAQLPDRSEADWIWYGPREIDLV